MAQKQYSAAQLKKYKEIAEVLEKAFVNSKKVTYFEFPAFVKKYAVSPCLQTMLIRLGYIQAVQGKHNWSVLKAHPFQSMSRNPAEMLALITDYNTEKKWGISQKNSHLPIPPEPEIVEILEVNTDELKDISESAEHRVGIYLSNLANKLANERVSKVEAAWDEAVKGIRDPILGSYRFPVKDTLKDILLPACLDDVTKVFYDAALELMVKEVPDGETD